MRTKHKSRIRAFVQVALLGMALASSLSLWAAEEPARVRVYVLDFQQNGKSPAFPDLDKFLAGFLRLRFATVPELLVAPAEERPPCDPSQGLSPKGQDRSRPGTMGYAFQFYTVRGFLELRKPDDGANAEMLVSYELAKTSECGRQSVLTSQTDKFSMDRALDGFGSIADLLATKLRGEVTRRITIDIFR